MDIQSVIQQLQAITDIKRVSGGWIVFCPFHADSKASMKVWDSGGWCCLGCGAKGSITTLKKRLDRISGRERSQILKGRGNRESVSSTPIGKIVKEYIYRNETGTSLYKVCRYYPKDFRAMHKWKGGWRWGMKNGRGEVRRVLYNLDEITARQADTVVLVEGEKDADKLFSIGILSTTVPFGAGRWRNEYRESLRNRNVVLIPDNDEQGIKHMEAIKMYLTGVAKRCEVWTLPVQYKDVSDWIDDGGDISKLRSVLCLHG